MKSRCVYERKIATLFVVVSLIFLPVDERGSEEKNNDDDYDSVSPNLIS